jgi:hypothetical protein
VPSRFHDPPYRPRERRHHHRTPTDNGHRHGRRGVHNASPPRAPAAADLTLLAGQPVTNTTNVRCRCQNVQVHRMLEVSHTDDRTRESQPATTAMQSPAILVARWVLVCRGTTRHTTARHDTGTGEVADETVQTDTEITDPIAEQRTLNPRVRGSSPWRRTRAELGVLDDIGSAQWSLCGGFEAMVAPWLLLCQIMEPTGPAPAENVIRAGESVRGWHEPLGRAAMAEQVEVGHTGSGHPAMMVGCAATTGLPDRDEHFRGSAAVPDERSGQGHRNPPGPHRNGRAGHRRCVPSVSSCCVWSRRTPTGDIGVSTVNCWSWA